MKYILNNTTAYKKVARLIRSYGYNPNSLAKVLGCSRPTAKAKLDDPERFTIKDLVLLNNYGKVPFSEVGDALLDWTRLYPKD